MKSMKQIGTGVFLAISVLVTVWYASCSKDACKGITCLNAGMCNGGTCQCDSGTGGNNCEVVYRNLYVNTYIGPATFNFSTTDTVDKNHTDIHNSLVFSVGNGNDSNFTKMQLVWSDTSSSVTFPILLSNNSAAGSDFTITSAVTSGSYSYTGYGSVSTTVASLTLIQTPTLGGTPVTIIMNNFTP